MTKLLVAYGATLVTFVGFDFVFLSLFGVKAYKTTLGDVMNPSANLVPAVLFYLIFVGGIVYFAITQSFQQEKWSLAVQNGAIFGFLAYLTYDFTNLAVIRNWTWSLALIDVGWGTVLSAVTAGIGAAVATRIVG